MGIESAPNPDKEGMNMSRLILPNGTTSRQASTHPRDSLLQAAIYARVSTAEQADRGYSLPTQIEACQRLAQQAGYAVPESHIFVDDYTGMSLNRPQFTTEKCATLPAPPDVSRL